MSIDRAYCDCWRGDKDVGTAIENPSWEDIEKMILSLVEKEKTLVTIGNYDDGYYMAIGGGDRGQYIAYVSYDDEERIYNLIVSSKNGKEVVELVVGGQRGKFPLKMCVTQNMVLSAAKRFFENQELDPCLEWEE